MFLSVTKRFVCVLCSVNTCYVIFYTLEFRSAMISKYHMVVIIWTWRVISGIIPRYLLFIRHRLYTLPWSAIGWRNFQSGKSRSFAFLIRNQQPIIMFRTTLQRTAPCVRLAIASGQSRPNSSAPPAKLEVYIDDTKVQVDPGTTVLQVRNVCGSSITFTCPP